MVDKRVSGAKNIPEALGVLAELFSGLPSMRYKDGPNGVFSQTYTYRQMLDAIHVIGTVLAEKYAISPDQKVAMISENRAEYNLADFAVMSIGAVPWGLYDFDMKTPDAVEYKLNDSGSQLIATSAQFLEPVRKIVNAGKTPVKNIVVLDSPYDTIKYESNETPLSEILKSGKKDLDMIGKRLASVNRDDVARLIYTSGTTGNSKGVMLMHGNLLSNADGASTVYAAKEGVRFISYLPEAHSFQGILTLMTLFNGGEIWYAHKKTLVEDVKAIRPQMFPGVPMVYKKFAEGMREKVLELTKGHIDLAADYSKHPIKRFLRGKVVGPKALKKAGLSEVIQAVSGSAKLDLQHASILENVGFYVLEGYGISETSPVITVERPTAKRRGSVGTPIPGVEVKIMSLEEDINGKRNEQPRGEKGEVLAKGPNVFKGYFNDPEKTKKAFYDGYYLTGDLGHIDQDGFLFIHGRCGLQVKMSNGEFVDLDKMAADILRHTTLVQAAAVDAELKEYAIAIVSLNWEPEALTALGAKLGVPFNGNVMEFAKNEKVVEAIKNELTERHEKFGDARNPKTPKKFLIVAPMSPETGEITSTMKSKVRFVLAKYQDKVDQLRKSDEKFMVYIP